MLSANFEGRKRKTKKKERKQLGYLLSYFLGFCVVCLRSDMRGLVIPFNCGRWNERPGKSRRLAIYVFNSVGMVSVRVNDRRWLKESILNWCLVIELMEE